MGAGCAKPSQAKPALCKRPTKVGCCKHLRRCMCESNKLDVKDPDGWAFSCGVGEANNNAKWSVYLVTLDVALVGLLDLRVLRPAWPHESNEIDCLVLAIVSAVTDNRATRRVGGKARAGDNTLNGRKIIFAQRLLIDGSTPPARLPLWDERHVDCYVPRNGNISEFFYETTRQGSSNKESLISWKEFTINNNDFGSTPTCLRVPPLVQMRVIFHKEKKRSFLGTSTLKHLFLFFFFSFLGSCWNKQRQMLNRWIWA